MNEWRGGYTGRLILHGPGDEWWTFKSEHPLEDRVLVLTDAYRDEDGNFYVPECVAPEPWMVEPGADDGLRITAFDGDEPDDTGEAE